ncbi:MAG: hypothetical protein VW518_07565, partial [Burkholderiaceae bacterium]
MTDSWGIAETDDFNVSDAPPPDVGLMVKPGSIEAVVMDPAMLVPADSSLYVDFGLDLNLDGDNDHTTYADWDEVTYSTVRIDPSWIAEDGSFSVDAALTGTFYQMDLSLGPNAYAFVSNVLFVDKDGDEYSFGSDGSFDGMWSTDLASEWNQEVFSVATGDGPILDNYIEIDPVWLTAKFHMDHVPDALDSAILFNAT